jgi:multidrug efflux pump subunit AcrA (membrane-fusion protein)
MALSRKKKIIIGVSALWCWYWSWSSASSPRAGRTGVTTVKVDASRTEIDGRSGEVRPIQYIKLTKVPGRILEIMQSGDVVKKNQALVRVDPTQLQSARKPSGRPPRHRSMTSRMP